MQTKGTDMTKKPTTPRQHKLFYGSSYDRGLEHLLQMWPEIRQAFPDAELHICYGWDMYDKAYGNNPERQAWKHRMNDDMDQPGIKHHGRLSKRHVKKLQKKCGIWAYPTHFGETCCITALESQAHGCVPVTMNLAALRETVQSGYKIEGDIYDEETQVEYLTALLHMMKDEEFWAKESAKGIAFSEQFTWSNIAKHWANIF